MAHREPGDVRCKDCERKHLPGKSRCKKCAAEHNKRATERRERLRDERRCVVCGKPAAPDGRFTRYKVADRPRASLCAEHLAYYAARNAEAK